MPQDQFDNWLRSRVDSASPVDGADREWAMIQYRLQRDRKKRRGMFWWWSGLGVLLLFIISMTLISQQDESTYSQNSEIERNSTKDQLDSRNIDHVVEGKVDREVYESADIKDQESNLHATPKSNDLVNAETVGSTTNNSNRNFIDSKNRGQEEVISTQGDIDRSNFQVDSKEEPSSPKKIEVLKAVSPSSIAETREFREKVSELSFLPTEVATHLYINRELNILNEREDQKPSFARGNSQKWQLEIGLFGGWSSHVFKGGNEEWNNILSRHESSKEQVGGEILAWRKIAPGWSVGSGLGYRYSHRQLSQYKLDTMSSQAADQLLGLLEDADGQIRTYSGAGQGEAIIEVDRELHMTFHELRVPIGVQYQRTLSDRWVVHSGVMMVPSVYFQRNGRSIDRDPTVLKASQIMDRYESDLTFNSRIRAGLDYRLSPQLQLGVGLQWEKQWNDTKMIEGMKESGQGVHLTLGLKMNL